MNLNAIWYTMRDTHFIHTHTYCAQYETTAQAIDIVHVIIRRIRGQKANASLFTKYAKV